MTERTITIVRDDKHCSPGCKWLLENWVCSLFREGHFGQRLTRDASGGVFASIECRNAVDIVRRWEAAEREKQNEALDDILEATHGG